MLELSISRSFRAVCIECFAGNQCQSYPRRPSSHVLRLPSALTQLELDRIRRVRVQLSGCELKLKLSSKANIKLHLK